jgi:hypothetical protein
LYNYPRREKWLGKRELWERERESWEKGEREVVGAMVRLGEGETPGEGNRSE